MIKVKSDSFGKKIHLEKAECQEFQWEPGGGGGVDYLPVTLSPKGSLKRNITTWVRKTIPYEDCLLPLNYSMHFLPVMSVVLPVTL